MQAAIQRIKKPAAMNFAASIVAGQAQEGLTAKISYGNCCDPFFVSC